MSLSGLGLSGLSGVAGGYTPALASATHHWAARLESGYSNGNTMTTLNDRIGSLSLSSAGTAPPTFTTNQINGLPAASLTGVDGHFIASGATGVSGSAANTIFVVAQVTSGSGDRRLFNYGSAAGTNGQIRGMAVDPSWRFNGGSRVFNAPTNPNSWHIWVGFAASGANYQNHRFVVDGTSLTQASVTNGTLVPNVQDQEVLVGAARNSSGNLQGFFPGYIAEIVFLPTYTVDLVNFHGRHLAAIYGLTWNTFAG